LLQILTNLITGLISNLIREISINSENKAYSVEMLLLTMNVYCVLNTAHYYASTNHMELINKGIKDNLEIIVKPETTLLARI